eukprot:5978568-Pleurochrysis_carterae.AAC.1
MSPMFAIASGQPARSAPRSSRRLGPWLRQELTRVGNLGASRGWAPSASSSGARTHSTAERNVGPAHSCSGRTLGHDRRARDATAYIERPRGLGAVLPGVIHRSCSNHEGRKQGRTPALSLQCLLEALRKKARGKRQPCSYSACKISEPRLQNVQVLDDRNIPT